jgi:hypothetical protein
MMWIWPVIVFGQVYYDAGFISEWNTHPFYYRNDSSDVILNPNFGISYEKSHWSIGYSGDYYSFLNVKERDFYYHSFQLDFFGKRTGLQFNFSQRINKTNYSYFDYFTYGIAFKIVINNQWFRGQIYGKANRYEYKELPEFNNWKFQLNFRFNKRIFPQTTLLWNVFLVNKNYTYSTSNYTLQSSQLVSFSTKSSGNDMGGGMNGGGRGGMWEDNNWGAHYVYQQVDYPSVTKGYINLRLAQGLLPRLGLALYGTGGWVVSGDSRLVSGPGTATASNDIFDLSLGYDEYGSGAELTYVTANLINMKLGYQFFHKNYLNEGIFTDDTTFQENTLRRDEIQRIWFQAAYSIYPDKSFFQQADLFFLAEYFINRSNSYWYDFKGSSISLGISLAF